MRRPVFSLLAISLACSADIRPPHGGGGGGAGAADATARDVAAADALDLDQGLADAGLEDAALEDAGLEDAGFTPDALDPDLGFLDAQRAEIGGLDLGIGNRDVSFPEAGGFDLSFPSFDGSWPEIGGLFDGGAVQTTVRLVPGSVSVWLNLQPPVAMDPLFFTAEASFNNVGAADEQISFPVARLSILAGGLMQHSFVVEPDHLAPVGQSTKMIMKRAGSGMGTFATPSMLCNATALLRIEVSNGQLLFEPVTVTCVF